MTADEIPSSPSVLNTTVLSNFAYIDEVWVLADLAGICAVPVVRDELERGVGAHPYLQSALDTLGSEIPVVAISDTVANRETALRDHLDPGEAQAFAVADAHDGRLLTDDGDARSFANDQGVTVVGSVGVLLAAIDAGKIDDPTAEEWLSTWIDEIGYYVPYRSIAEYR
jgi:predicted nucleic acid-binding protein